MIHTKVKIRPSGLQKAFLKCLMDATGKDEKGVKKLFNIYGADEKGF